MIKRLLTLVTTSLSFLLLASTATAGSWQLNFQPNGKVDLALSKSDGKDFLLVTLLPMTGDRFSGPADCRVDGVSVEDFEGAPYYLRIPISKGGCIKALHTRGKDNNFQKGVGDINLNDEWFLRQHTVEFYFKTTDDRGHTDKNKADAPAMQFRLNPNKDDSGTSPMTNDQAKAGFADAYNKGVADAQKASESDRAEMLRKIQELSDKITELEKNKHVPAPETLVKRCFTGKLLRLPGVTDMVGQRYEVYRFREDGKRVSLGEAVIVKYDAKAQRASFEALLPPDIDPARDREILRMAWKRPGDK